MLPLLFKYRNNRVLGKALNRNGRENFLALPETLLALVELYILTADLNNTSIIVGAKKPPLPCITGASNTTNSLNTD